MGANEVSSIAWIKERLTPTNIYFLIWCLIQREPEHNYQPCGKDYVTLESFTNFLSCWNGQRSPLINCLNIVSRRFFYGCISWPKTLSLFENQSIGAFLIRLSYKSPHQLGIAFVEQKGDSITVSQLRTPVKFPRHQKFPGFYDHLASYYPMKETD